MWKGRSADHNLASGLDDYPRGLQVKEGERHLDMYMWLVMFCQSLVKAADILENGEDAEIFRKSLETLKSFEDKFVDRDGVLGDYMAEQYLNKQGHQAYYWRGDSKCRNVMAPIGLPAECNPYGDKPCCSEFGWCGNEEIHCKCKDCFRALRLEDRKDLTKTSLFSPHVGYVSLMPLIAGFVEPGSYKFNKILEFISSPEHLWSDHGLRSLSKTDLLFKSGENYWRGEIWLNFNFLVLRAFKRHYWSVERVRKIYAELRENIINTVRKSWEETGYVWETYSENAGNGLRVHPFAGWTSLILNIIHEKY